jgi:HK97 gp10 family phage protein
MGKNTAKIDLEGMEALMNEFKKLGIKVDATVKDKAVKRGAEFLREKIEHHPNMPRSNEAKEHGQDHIQIEKEDNGQYFVGAHKDHFYLIFTELGAEGGLYRGRKSDNRDFWYLTPDIERKPFARPSLEENSGEIQRIMGESIKGDLGL